MNAKKELLDYILNLTPEQAEKVIRHFPRLLSELEEPASPSPREEKGQNQ